MTGIITTVLAISQFLMVYSYETPYTDGPVIEIVASCQQGQVRATDIDWTTLIKGKKNFYVKDKRGERNKCIYLTK